MQILVGRVSSSNKDGIQVSLDFFDDVFIPSYLLQAPSEFNPTTSLWLWKYGEEDSGDEFVMDIGGQVEILLIITRYLLLIEYYLWRFLAVVNYDLTFRLSSGPLPSKDDTLHATYHKFQRNTGHNNFRNSQ